MNLLQKGRVIWGIDARFSGMSGPLLRTQPELVEALRRYGMPEVVARLGEPSQVLLGIETEPVEPGAYWTYATWLDYSDIGVVISYVGNTISPLNDAGAFRICQDFDGVDSIWLFLRSPDVSHTIVEMTEGSADISRQLAEGSLRNTDTAIGLSAGQFADALQAQGDNACFDAQLQ